MEFLIPQDADGGLGPHYKNKLEASNVVTKLIDVEFVLVDGSTNPGNEHLP